ncbi:Predicted amidohydrolase [Oribacterium sp. KHPX15]|uniref:amidohydrolase family protein n=1 Tax=Oribacterium sp. KHPX15 TaxID=1855342 RepID=UPI000895B77D|nr:amidohydrolase family protein [Oribacterium sp. KHPX15]SEA91929.1 Predicted amidohydrolase [Oribacterium sp. KHPX15]
MKVDYVIRGGHVIDPASGTNEVKDVYVKNMHIVAPGDETVECKPYQIIDASGMYVTPGLIDFHTHVFHEGSTICIHPDMMIAQGTTSCVDAGSAGTSTFEAFAKNVIHQSLIRVKGFLTVYGGGQLDPKLCEDFNPKLYNIEKMERVIDANRNDILGLKIRLSKGVVPDETGADYLKAAVELADKLNDKLGTKLRVCVHTTNAPVPADELAKCLRPGDIFCHCYQGAGNTIVDSNGKVLEGILKARNRGVIFDAANGQGNFGLKVAKQAIADGFLADIISSDLTVDKFNMPPYAKNLPLIISKYLAMGVDLYEIIKRVTEIPAKLMGMDNKIGTLREGAYADIAVFKLKDHHYIQKDFCDDEIICEKILIPLMTMLSGEIQYCQSDFYL